MKKKVGLLLSLLTICSLATSCGETIDPNADWTIDVNANKSNITLKTYFPASGKNNSFFQNSYIPTKLKEITGYDVIYNQTSESSADTQVQALLTGKEKIDMLKISPTLFNNYVTQGYFTDLTEGIKKYCPNVLECVSEEQWEAVTYNGKIYALPECGHTSMVNVGLVWNFDHLKSVGISTIPETISDVDNALRLLQKKYGEGNANYHALGLPGTMSESNPFTPAFEVPCKWFINDDGEIENMLFSDNMEKYLDYMHTLVEDNIIAKGWSTQVESAVINNFVSSNSSCAVVSYWNITALRQSLIASYKGFPSGLSNDAKKDYIYGTNEHEYGVASSDALLQWNQFIKGDGTKGTVYQEVGKSRDSRGVGYFITVPVASSKNAAYTLDWINYKLTEEATILNVAGDEGVHYEKTTKDNKDAVKLNTADGEKEEYVKVLDKFYDDINGMSQYQTSVNCDVARKWWPVAEVGFDSWSILIDESRVISDPFALHPVLAEFSKNDLLAQNYVVTQLQNCINNGGDTLSKARATYTSRFWKDSVKNEVNNWYKNK